MNQEQSSSRESDNAFTGDFELSVNPNHFPVEKFQPISQIGKGSSGTVFLCRDRTTRQTAAVKVLAELNEDQLAAFAAEARAIANISHPAIINLIDFGSTASGLLYIALEYFDGARLHDYIENSGPFSLVSACRMTINLAEGLALLHSRGILHRDISSYNVLVRINRDRNFEVKLIDFGSAHTHHESIEKFALAGTPLYMAPDVPLGLPYDARSEVYSLGCMLFEMLTARVPYFGRSPMETINMHAVHPVPTLESATSGIQFPEPLEAIVSRCLAKQPQHRYQSMLELKQALIKAFSS